MNVEAQSGYLAGIDKAVLLALAMPVAYLLAFEHDRGFLNHFGVPDALDDDV
jgi:hypothetical protein